MSGKVFIIILLIHSPCSLSLLQESRRSEEKVAVGGGRGNGAGSSSPDATGGAGVAVIPVYAAGAGNNRRSNNNHSAARSWKSGKKSVTGLSSLGLVITLSMLVIPYQYML